MLTVTLTIMLRTLQKFFKAMVFNNIYKYQLTKVETPWTSSSLGQIVTSLYLLLGQLWRYQITFLLNAIIPRPNSTVNEIFYRKLKTLDFDAL